MKHLLTAAFLTLSGAAQACELRSNPDILYSTRDGALPALIQTCLNDGLDFEAPLSNGKPPFVTIVATTGSLQAVELMLDAGVDPNTPGRYGGTAMTDAINVAYDAEDPAFLAIIQALIDAGADVNIVDSSGHTNLERAAGGGEVSLLRMLLAAGADPNILNPFDRTPLFETVFGRCRPEVGAILIEAGGGIAAMPTDQIDRMFDEAAESCAEVDGGAEYIARLETLRP